MRSDRAKSAPGKPKASGFSMAESHGSILVPPRGSIWRRWLAITGPAFLVAVGYMDPGNWATDLAAGSRYEYRLLWVLLMSNLMAMLLQSLAARLGIVRRLDLAQACREAFPRWVNLPLYILAEIAIAACDLAEVIGSAIALQLLFHLPLMVGVLLTMVDSLLLLLLTRYGIRRLEAVILSLVGTIGLAFMVEIILARPDWGLMARGVVPSFPDSGALYIAIGILGATVMPHNLYLHSALVQTRRFSGGEEETRRAIRLNTFDSVFVLNIAFFVNAAILVMAAAVFYRHGIHNVAEIQDAHHMLEPLVGAAIAPVAFAIALLASGQSSTVTGTLAGQIVMEGYLDLRLRPWLRRLLTRLLAVGPAVLALALWGDGALGKLLVLSQVVLSLQLSFATIPLVHFVSNRKTMGSFAIGKWTRTAAWTVVLLIAGLNIGLVRQMAAGWIPAAGPGSALIRWATMISALFLGGLLFWVIWAPWWQGRSRPGPGPVKKPRRAEVHREVGMPFAPLKIPEPIQRVAIALDFSGREEQLLAQALRFLGAHRPVLGLIHVVESPSARAFGREAEDQEMCNDAERLEGLAKVLREAGYDTHTALGAGNPVKELARLVHDFHADLVILGGHGHRGLSDLLHGTTAEALRHRISISVLVIPMGAETADS